jgi:K+-transporting ATPase ATPase C chain
MQIVLTAVRLWLVTLLACGVIYPFLVLGFASLVAPHARHGSLIRDRSGRIRGSGRIAQGFTRAAYFWPRPSAVNYDASTSGGSNLSPTNPALRERAKAILARLALPVGEKVPADLLTASGSGLDPHISLAAATLQVPRVAQARGLPQQEVLALVRKQADAPLAALLGVTPVVNVLRLNVALDALQQ